MNDCIFCQIIEGKIPCKKIYEDDDVLAFLDIASDSYGHTLVIPKTHCVNILDADLAVLSKVMAAVQKIARHYTEHCGFSGVNILNASGKDAQQSVFHLHFHVIPRAPKDGLDLWPLKDKKELDLDTICRKLTLL